MTAEICIFGQVRNQLKFLSQPERNHGNNNKVEVKYFINQDPKKAPSKPTQYMMTWVPVHPISAGEIAHNT